MERYIPKSKVNILQTTGTEFIIASTNQPYIGNYMELSNGTFFAGNNPQKPGEELLRRQELNVSFGRSKNNRIYRKLQKPIFNELSKKTIIPVDKPQPTNKDYERGYFTRYFCKRVNDQYNYFEINKKTYDELRDKTTNYDYNLYNIGKIKWTLLETPKNPVEKINDINIKLSLDTYPLLNTFFNDLTEYEPLHTRNFVETLSIDTGTELIPYEGYFHEQPGKGFMEGPFHTTKPHKKLFTVSELEINRQKINTNLSTRNNATLRRDRRGDTVSVMRDNTYNRSSAPSTPRPSSTPSAPSTPSIPSGGGGGGY